MAGLLNTPFFQELVDEHRAWLQMYEAQYLRNWEKVLNGDREAGMTEAVMRRYLQQIGITVEPNEDLTGVTQAPDIRCLIDGNKFFVEVTCISIAKATAEVGLPPDHTGAAHHGTLGDSVFEACRSKAPQCSNADGPVMLAVCTFHGLAAMFSFDPIIVNMLLTGNTMITWDVDPNTGSSVGDTYLSTQFRSAAFLRPLKEEGFGFARSSISGLLLCGVCFTQPTVLGILHPNPVRAFQPQLLPNVGFGQVHIDAVNGRISTTWAGGGINE